MILIVAVVAVLGYFILSANGIKLFGKKEHKVKAKKSNEEKYSDVLPKEKTEKNPKKTGVKISDSAKKEKLKDDIKKEIGEKSGVATKSAGSGTVSKITKEDFLKNNIEVPTTLLTEEEKKAMTAKSLPKAKEQPSKPYDFGLPDFSSPAGFSSPSKGFPLDDPLTSSDDPFADIDFDSILNGTSSPDKPFTDSFADFDVPDSGFGGKSKPSSIGLGAKSEYNQKSSSGYFNPSTSFDMDAQTTFDADPIMIRSLDERFEQVFGANYASVAGSKMGKEIIIGDILKGPRVKEVRARRSERERRRKWM
jgi:hypothetical protein